MAARAYKCKVEHNNFLSMRDGFKDCVRYSKAKVLEESIDGAIIEIPPGGNPSMRKEGLKLYLHRWESFGFKLTKL